MQFFRQILVVFFASVIFLGTVGVNVFAHYCKVDGVDYSFIVQNEDHCSKEQAEDACCMIKIAIEKDAKQLEEDCCSDEVTSFKIASEIFQKEISSSQVIAVSTLRSLEVFLVTAKDYQPNFHYFNDRQPIPKSGRALLIQNQVFSI